MNTKELIAEAISLPVEERVRVADSLLKSLNQPQSELDKQWVDVSKQRLAELKSGAVEAIPAKAVFQQIFG